MSRRVYPISIKINGKRLESVVIDPHYEEKHAASIVVVHLSRKAVRPTKIGQLSLKEGELAAPSAYLAHRNPDIFPEPARFQPERFLGEPPPRYSYFPYGLGNRTCYGRPLAHRQMKLILSTILREFEVELLSRGTPVPTRKMVLVIPQHGTMIVRVK